MTRRFNTQIKCPQCGALITAETALERWIRNHPGLHSVREGLVRFDLDILIHKYKIFIDKKGTREIQCQMFIEAKTNGAVLDESQRDSFSMLSQIMRNRKSNIYSERKGLHASNHTPPCKVISHLLQKEISLRLFGGHLWTLSGNDPNDSEWMTWDYKPVTVDQIISVLRFEIDPDNLDIKMDWRRRSSDFEFELPLFKKSA